MNENREIGVVRRFVTEIKVLPHISHNLIRTLCEAKVTSYDLEVYEVSERPPHIKGCVSDTSDNMVTIRVYERCY